MDGTVTPGLQQLKALSHPARVRMLGLLRVDGPATATMLAARLGLNSGATSYHLRQLAQHGFVVDDDERGNGRERWWKAAHSATAAPEPAAGTEGDEALDAYLQSVVVVMTELLQRSVEERPLLSQEWRQASRIGDWVIDLTPQRARAVVDALVADIEELPADRDTDDAEAFVIQLHAFPLPGRIGASVVRRPLYGWLASEAVSITGTRVSMIALPFFVLDTTGSAGKAGLVALAEMLPLVLMKALGGPVIDRFGARRVSIGCDLGSVAVVGAIPLLYAVGALPFPLFLAFVALAGALRGPGDGAKHALTPTLVDHAGVPMERATGLHSTVERTASMLGAAAAGGLVALVGPANALLLDAASFGLSAALLAWATTPLKVAAAAAEAQRTAEPHPTAGGSEYLQQLREGWEFLRGDRVLVGITVMVTLTNMLDIAYASVLVPVWGVESGGGAAVVGLLFAVFSGASALGALCAAAWAALLPRYWTYLLAFLVCGAPRFAVLALESPMWAVLAVGAAAGFGAGFINPVLGAVVYERIPEHLVGRVTSLSSAACYALMPFGGVLAGLLIGGLGLTAALTICGAAYLAFTMLPALDPRWREIDRRPPRDVEVPAAAA